MSVTMISDHAAAVGDAGNAAASSPRSGTTKTEAMAETVIANASTAAMRVPVRPEDLTSSKGMRFLHSAAAGLSEAPHLGPRPRYRETSHVRAWITIADSGTYTCANAQC